jgi:hypothetical protein
METNQRISAVTRMLHSGTREPAELTAVLEPRTQLLNWSVTAFAWVLGLVVAFFITRNQASRVRELLDLPNAIRSGNLEILIDHPDQWFLSSSSAPTC